jgi:antitoxin component YwqK of YwqJK toxin-antitoxin module
MPIVKGLKHGKLIWYYESGDIKITQEVKKGEANGRIIFYYEGNVKEHEGVIKTANEQVNLNIMINRAN